MTKIEKLVSIGLGPFLTTAQHPLPEHSVFNCMLTPRTTTSAMSDAGHSPQSSEPAEPAAQAATKAGTTETPNALSTAAEPQLARWTTISMMERSFLDHSPCVSILLGVAYNADFELIRVTHGLCQFADQVAVADSGVTRISMLDAWHMNTTWMQD